MACGRPKSCLSDGISKVGVVQQVAEVGLTSEQAARLLAEYGPNRLPAHRPTPWWRRLAAEMVHFFALLFWVAGGLAFVAGLPQLGIAIFVVIVLNGVFAFAQEERAQHATERLRTNAAQADHCPARRCATTDSG